MLLSCLKWTFITLITLFLTGVCYEYYSRWHLERTAFSGKTFVGIHGKPLHYVKKGHGHTTVIFASGMGSSYGIWQEIQNSVSQHAVTLAYDRNGLMLSDANDLPVTNSQVSEELELLLEKTKCPKPYIIVAHSMAGIYLRPFIQDHQKDISGIIFAEASHPQQLQSASPALLKALSPPPAGFIKFVVATGIYRLLFSLTSISPEIPFGHPLHRLERDFFYRSRAKIMEELANDRINFKDAERYPGFGAIPLTVVTGTSEIRYARIKSKAVRDEYRQLTESLQHDLLRLSSRSRLVKAEHSGHILQVHNAPLLIAEIRRML